MRTQTLCLDYTTESLSAILSQLPPEAENVLLCGPLPDPGHSELVAWVYHPEVMAEWSDAGTYLGQEEDHAPTIALRRGEQTIRLRWSSAWFDGPIDAPAAQAAFGRADALIQQRFRLDEANFAAPVALGRHLMAAAWSRDGIRVPPAPSEVRELLQTVGPQGRHECLTLPELETIPGLYEYDLRLAYLWCCKALPYGALMRTGGDLPDGHKMLCRWEAPDGWQQVGLLPERRQGWQYPLRGSGWVDRREYELAHRSGWGLRVLGDGLLWQSEGALDRWADGLQWCLRQSKEDEVVYRLFRRVALNTIGSLHRSSVRRLRALSARVREAPPAGNPTLRLSADGSVYYWQEEEPLTSRALLYCHPEWTTTIWARCRARLAQAALQFPREQVIAIRQDALFVTHPHPSWGDDGSIGRFRVKRSYSGPLPAPHTLEALQAIRRSIE